MSNFFGNNSLLVLIIIIILLSDGNCGCNTCNNCNTRRTNCGCDSDCVRSCDCGCC